MSDKDTQEFMELLDWLGLSLSDVISDPLEEAMVTPEEEADLELLANLPDLEPGKIVIEFAECTHGGEDDLDFNVQTSPDMSLYQTLYMLDFAIEKVTAMLNGN